MNCDTHSSVVELGGAIRGSLVLLAVRYQRGILVEQILELRRQLLDLVF